MKKLLLLISILFLSIIGSSQLLPDWAKHVGHKTLDITLGNFSLDNNQNMYIYGQDAQYIDLDPSHNKAYATWDGASTFDIRSAFISCYDSLGNFKWANGIKVTSSTTFPPLINYLLVDDSNHLYVIGTINAEADFDFDTSTYLVGTGGGLMGYIASYDQNQKLKYVYTFPETQFITDAKIANNKIWLSGFITDSGFIDIKNDSVMYLTNDTVIGSYKRDAFIASYNFDLALQNYKIFNSQSDDQIPSFDVSKSKVVIRFSFGAGILTGITDTLTIDGVDILITNAMRSKVLLLDTSLIVDSVLQESIPHDFVIDIADNMGYFITGSYKPIPSRDEGFAYGYDWNGDTIYQWISDLGTGVEAFGDCQLDTLNKIVYLHGGIQPGSLFYNGYTDTTYRINLGSKNGLFSFKLSDSSLAVNLIHAYNTNTNVISFKIFPPNNIYITGTFYDYFNLDNLNPYTEYAEQGNKKNMLIGRYSKICRPISFNNYTPDTSILCGFSHVSLETDVQGSGLRYQWLENNFSLADVEYTVGSYYYLYTGTKTRYLQTTLVSNGNNRYDTNYIYCQITSNCQTDTVSQTFLRLIVSKPSFFVPTGHSVNVGDTLPIIVNLVADYPLGYQWYHNNISLFDNSVYTGTDSSTLTITNTQWYHSGMYNLEIYPLQCPNLGEYSNDIPVNFAISDIQTNSLADINVFPNPVVDVTNISMNNNLINEVKSINIISIEGKKTTLFYNMRNNTLSINLATFSKGSYLIEVNTSTNTYYTSITKI